MKKGKSCKTFSRVRRRTIEIYLIIRKIILLDGKAKIEKDIRKIRIKWRRLN